MPEPGDKHYTHLDRDDAPRHIQAMIDQADRIVFPDGIEALYGEWEDEDHVLITFQRDFGSAVGAYVMVLSPSDARNLANMINELLDGNPPTS
jgi:hypothetical protein